VEHSVTSRPIRPDDADRLLRLLHRMSPDTVYRRFFSPVVRPSPAVLARLATVDHGDREALVALVDDEIIAVARYDRLPDDPTRAEMAVVVEDAWQHDGVGRWLVQRLGELAASRCVEAFTATVLTDNDAIIGLIRSMSRRARFTTVSGESDVVMPLVRATA